MLALTIISLILNVIAVGPVLVVAWLWLRQWRRARTILSFTHRGPLDVVVASTNATERRQGKTLSRPATGFGQVVGVTSAMAVLTRLYPKKPVRVCLSARMSHDSLTEDLILLGAPVSNRVAGEFLEAISKPEEPIGFDSEGTTLSVPGYSVRNYDLKRHGKPAIPMQDLGLIIVTANPWATNRRAVLCCGFSTYGTAAAATYLFEKVIPARDIFWQDDEAAPRRSGRFGLIVKVSFTEEGRIIGSSHLHGFRLDEA